MLEQRDTDTLQRADRREEEEGSTLQWQRVAQLLGCKYDRIDPVQALPLLPLQVNYSAAATTNWPLPVVAPAMLSAVAIVGCLSSFSGSSALCSGLLVSENLQTSLDVINMNISTLSSCVKRAPSYLHSIAG